MPLYLAENRLYSYNCMTKANRARAAVAITKQHARMTAVSFIVTPL